MSSRVPPYRLVLFAALFEGCLGLFALGLGWLLGVRFWVAARIEWQAVGWGAICTAPLFAMLLCLEWLPYRPFATLRRVVSRLMTELFADATIHDLALVSVLAGLGEEFLFRGLLQTAVSQWTGWPMVGLLVASLLFGLAHLVTKTYAVLATLIGLYLGWVYLHFDNLLVPIVAHALYDFLALVYLLRRGGD